MDVAGKAEAKTTGEPERDHTELGSHIEVLVNDEVLGVSYELDSPLTGGERITLLGQFMGG